jgi:hypothetical protein
MLLHLLLLSLRLLLLGSCFLQRHLQQAGSTYSTYKAQGWAGTRQRLPGW